MKDSLRRAVGWGKSKQDKHTEETSGRKGQEETQPEADTSWKRKFAKLWVGGGTLQGTTEGATRTRQGDQSEGVYKNLGIQMALSRVEEPRNLAAALRHVVRTRHPKGEKITFPTPDALDRMQLLTAGLPAEPEELEDLVRQAFKRRGDNWDMEETYRDFVRAHGRIAFDPALKWPASHPHVRFP